MKLYLDDLRRCPPGWVLALDTEQAIKLVLENPIEEMSLDHDLGLNYCRSCAFSDADEPCFTDMNIMICGCTCHTEKQTGLDFLKWVRDNNKWPAKKPIVHSANIVGAQNMRNLIDDYGPYSK